MLKRQPPKEKYEMLPRYVGDYTSRTAVINFQTANEFLLDAEKRMIDKRRFRRKNSMTECKSYMKHEDAPEKKELFVYGFKHTKTDKIDNYTLIGSESDDLNKNIELISFWSSEFANKEMEIRIFGVPVWLFLSLVKKTIFLESRMYLFKYVLRRKDLMSIMMSSNEREGEI